MFSGFSAASAAYLNVSNDTLEQKNHQLKAVYSTIQQLESKGIPVPDELRGMKTSLVSEVDHIERSNLELAELKKGLEDIIKSLNSCMSRVTKPREREKGEKRQIIANQTPQSSYKPLIVKCLKSKGGSAHVSEVLKWIKEYMQGKFLSGDFQQRSAGNIVWEHNVHWARQHLVNDGILRDDSPRGYWQLSNTEVE